jgi:hypothetical protein
MDVRKVPASAGAEWLVQTFLLFRKSPLGFGVLALVYGGLSQLLALAANLFPGTIVPVLMQLVLLVVATFLIVGMIIAADEVTAGKQAQLSHLFAAVGQGKTRRVFAMLVPQVLALLISLVLLMLIVGPEDLEKINAVMLEIQREANAGRQVDPQMLLDAPIGAFMVWIVAVVALGFCSVFLTLTMIPDMIFNGVGVFSAMKRSFVACMKNILAVAVLMVLGLVVSFCILFALGVVLGLLQFVLGNAVIIVAQILANGFFASFIAGVMYFAWKQLLGDGSPAATSPSASTGIEV